MNNDTQPPAPSQINYAYLSGHLKGILWTMPVEFQPEIRKRVAEAYAAARSFAVEHGE